MKQKVLFGILLVIFGWMVGSASAQDQAPMKMYVREGCGSCTQVLEREAQLIERLQVEGQLQVIDVTDRATDLPGYPALVDGRKVVVGTGIGDYLRASATDHEQAI